MLEYLIICWRCHFPCGHAEHPMKHFSCGDKRVVLLDTSWRCYWITKPGWNGPVEYSFFVSFYVIFETRFSMSLVYVFSAFKYLNDLSIFYSASLIYAAIHSSFLNWLTCLIVLASLVFSFFFLLLLLL